jgi:hypothetical protein
MLNKEVKRAVGIEPLEGLMCIQVQHLPDLFGRNNNQIISVTAFISPSNIPHLTFM